MARGNCETNGLGRWNYSMMPVFKAGSHIWLCLLNHPNSMRSQAYMRRVEIRDRWIFISWKHFTEGNLQSYLKINCTVNKFHSLFYSILILNGLRSVYLTVLTFIISLFLRRYHNENSQSPTRNQCKCIPIFLFALYILIFPKLPIDYQF